MTASARKNDSREKHQKRRSAERPGPKATEARVARIVDLRFAKLRKQLKTEFEEHSARIERQLEELAKTNPIVRGVIEMSKTPSNPVSDQQMAAREEFFAEVIKHNDEPSDEDVEAMVRSWSE